MAKNPKFIPVSDLSQKTREVLKDVLSGEQVFIILRGQPIAVIVSLKSYERSQQELDILRLLAFGEKDIEAGIGFELNDVLQEADGLLKK